MHESIPKIKPEDFPNLLARSLRPLRLCLQATVALGSSGMLSEACVAVSDLMRDALLAFIERYPAAPRMQ
jgi:hypothetical protein